jgi:two-component system NtrC family response regulator
VRARVIAAMREPLKDSDSRVNADLVAALGSALIALPSLAERAVDIPLLADAFLAGGGDGAALQFEPDALAALAQYPWPGNVEELRAVVSRARLIARQGVIRAADLSLARADEQLELAEVERRHIVSVLEAKQWHQGRAAESLGISPKTLYRKIREFGLQRPAAGGRA